MSRRPSDRFRPVLSTQGLLDRLEDPDALAKYLNRKEAIGFLWDLHRTGGPEAMELVQNVLVIQGSVGTLARRDAPRLVDLIQDRSQSRQVGILSQPENLLLLALELSGRQVDGRRLARIVEPLEQIAPGKILTARFATEALTLDGDAEPLVRMIKRHPLSLQLEILTTGDTANVICQGGQAAALVDMIDVQEKLAKKFGILAIPYLLADLRKYGQERAAKRLTGEQPPHRQKILSTEDHTGSRSTLAMPPQRPPKSKLN